MNVKLPDGLPPLEQRGSSSIKGTEILRSQLEGLFVKYNINTMFDAGATDASWQWLTLTKLVNYSAGELRPEVVDYAKIAYPGLNIVQFDITKDSLPDVDLLFVRDVTIHLDNEQKEKFVSIWLSSNVPYLLISHHADLTENKNVDLNLPSQFAEVNWCIDPWNWPTPLENLWEMNPGGRSMSLWSQSQIKGSK